MTYFKPDILCICGSSGSLGSIQDLLGSIPTDFTIPIIILVHQQEDKESQLHNVFKHHIKRPVIVPNDGMKIENNIIYVAPSGYHMQIEQDKTISFAMDEPIHFSRPSIDILLETVAPVFQSGVLAIILSGSSKDGSHGAEIVESYQGTVWIQDPSTTPLFTMVTAAIDATEHPVVLSIPKMMELLQVIGGDTNATESTNC